MGGVREAGKERVESGIPKVVGTGRIEKTFATFCSYSTKRWEPLRKGQELG